jgi:(p)ppGpp synthase/HD superfamily hydrolase
MHLTDYYNEGIAGLVHAPLMKEKPHSTSNTPETIEATAERIAISAHLGQFRNDGTTPYIAHCAAVAARLREEGTDEETLAVAWLHDVLEDCPDWTEERLLGEGIPSRLIAAVKAMTKTMGEDYEDYIGRVKSNALASKVKVADMLCNLSDSPSQKQRLKYARGLRELNR